MAYMNQERKAKLAPAIKAICKKYGVKATFGVRNHSTLVCNIKSSSLDFIGNCNKVCGANVAMRGVAWTAAEGHLDVNPYHYDKHFDGKCLKFLTELFRVLNTGNHDNSDIQTDYFDVGWYVDVNIGRWNKPYELTKKGA